MSPSVVCLVDDAADFRFLVSTVFRQYIPLYSLQVFAQGKLFLDQLAGMENKPCLIILDQHMPELTGHQVLLALKNLPAYQFIPVVMMSNDASQSEISAFYQAGASSFIRKPIDLTQLKESLVMACQYAKQVNRQDVS